MCITSCAGTRRDRLRGIHSGFPAVHRKGACGAAKTIDHHDAVYNLARAALLAGSLTTGKLENLDAATGDCLHQPYRFGLIENGEDIVREAKKLGCTRRFHFRRRPVHRGDRLQGRPRLHHPCTGAVREAVSALEGRTAAL